MEHPWPSTHYPGRGNTISKPCRGEGGEAAMHAHIILFDKRFQRTMGFLSEIVTLECPLLVQGRTGMKLHVVEPASVRSQKKGAFSHACGAAFLEGCSSECQDGQLGMCSFVFSPFTLRMDSPHSTVLQEVDMTKLWSCSWNEVPHCSHGPRCVSY